LNDALDLPKPSGPRYSIRHLCCTEVANDECYPAIHTEPLTIQSGVKTLRSINLQLFLRIFLHDKLDAPAMLIAAVIGFRRFITDQIPVTK
jgi:hypothetical protein